jgi:choline dehydrogenase-like flavoprotein
MPWDCIIAGGGSAGSVLAARLSEDPHTRVILLEVGPRDWHPFYAIPAGFAKMTKGIESWGWQTVPQRHMQGMQIRFTQAKVLGGGSTVNARINTREHPLDDDEWLRRDAPAGATRTCCPISARPRITTPGTTAGTARAVRSG